MLISASFLINSVLVQKSFFFSFRYLRNVTVAQGDGKPDIAFSADGTLKSVELKIMNLRPDGRGSQDLIWEQVSHVVIKTSEAGYWFASSKCATITDFLMLCVAVYEDTKMAKNVRY